MFYTSIERSSGRLSGLLVRYWLHICILPCIIFVYAVMIIPPLPAFHIYESCLLSVTSLIFISLLVLFSFSHSPFIYIHSISDSLLWLMGISIQNKRQKINIFFSDKPRTHTNQLTSLPRIDSLLIIHWTVSSSNHFDACVGDLYHSLMKWFVRSHWFVCLMSYPVLFILYITWLVYIYY